MPPKPRTTAQFAVDKQKIIEEALEIIQKHGLQGLTMRELSKKLNMSATNLYNYFLNKDELYFHILMNGFHLLQNNISAALTGLTDPIDRLRCFLQEWIKFGTKYPAYYQLMFSTSDSKSMDFENTPIQEIAEREKAVAMQTYDMLVQAVAACAPDMDEYSLYITVTRIVYEVHGGLNLYHTNIVREILEDPKYYHKVTNQAVLDNLIQHILSEFTKKDSSDRYTK